MKNVALPVSGPGLDARLVSRFGRAPFFLVVDPRTFAAEAIENESKGAGSGAGIGATETLGRSKVTAVIGGQLGPKARAALEAAGIAAYRCPSGTTAREAVERFNAKELSRVEGAGSGSEGDQGGRMGGGSGEGRGGLRGGGGGGRERGRGGGRRS